MANRAPLQTESGPFRSDFDKEFERLARLGHDSANLDEEVVATIFQYSLRKVEHWPLQETPSSRPTAPARRGPPKLRP